MNQQDEFRIQHMIEASEEALSFLKNISKREFLKNRMLILSVIKEIEIIGEAASKISKETQSVHYDIPWKNIVGMRNRLIHGYFEIDEDLLWNTLKYNIPELLIQLRKLINR